MFKYTTNLLFVLFFSIQVFAQTDVPTGAPVCNDPIQITMLNGNKLEVICKGDSRLHWMETEDGYMLSQFENQYFFATIADGELIKTNIAVSKTNIATNKAQLDLLRMQNNQALSAIQSRSKSLKTLGGVPAKGKIKIPVLLVDFSDQTHTRSKENVEAMFCQNGHNNYGSVKEYYLRASHNQLDIEFDVFGWFQSGLKMEEVAENKGDKAAGKLVKKPLNLLMLMALISRSMITIVMAMLMWFW